MDLVLLKTFLKVAALGNLTKAAAALYVTQSAVSRRIKQLEETVGTPLLARSGTAVIPTEAGDLLIQTGRKMLEIEHEFFHSIGLSKTRQKLSFCCTPSLGIGGVSDIISCFCADHDKSVDLHCTFTMPEEALAGLDKGMYDLALIDHCEDLCLKGRDTYPLPDDEVVFVGAPALGIEAVVEIEQLLGHRLYLKSQNGCARRFIDKNLHGLGHSCADFASVVSFDDIPFIMREVIAGKGISFTSTSWPELQDGSLCAVRVRGFDHSRERSMVLGDQGLSPQHLLFIDYLFTHFGIPFPHSLFSSTT